MNTANAHRTEDGPNVLLERPFVAPDRLGGDATRSPPLQPFLRIFLQGDVRRFGRRHRLHRLAHELGAQVLRLFLALRVALFPPTTAVLVADDPGVPLAA